MIELPEAMVISRQISETLAGKRITHVIANAAPHKFAWYSGDPANYQNLLAGKTIRQASAYGNHIEIHADDMLLVISTPMKYHEAGGETPQKHQLFLSFDDHSGVSCTVQMWGGLFCFPKGEEGGMQDYQIARQKPSALSEAFTPIYFNELSDQAGKNVSAKKFLATKQRIPGLGNGVLQDILWTAHVHPRRKMEDLTGIDRMILYDAVKNVLRAMVEKGGRDTERDLFGLSGGYKTILCKNMVGSACPECGTTIHKESYLGGAIYYCPECQKP